MAWLKDKNIDVAGHPPCLPDLNPIEHIWVYVKRRLISDISSTPGQPNAVRNRLAEVLPEIWASLPDSYFEAIWQSMPARVAAVIEAKGWY